MSERNAPAAPEQHRDADNEDHRGAESRTHQCSEAGSDAEVIAPPDWSVVVSEQEVSESEHECGREEVVLDADAQVHDDQGRDGRDPRTDSRAPHYGPEQGRDCEVEDDRE